MALKLQAQGVRKDNPQKAAETALRESLGRVPGGNRTPLGSDDGTLMKGLRAVGVNKGEEGFKG